MSVNVQEKSRHTFIEVITHNRTHSSKHSLGNNKKLCFYSEIKLKSVILGQLDTL